MHELVLDFYTGGDDVNGYKGNIDVAIELHGAVAFLGQIANLVFGFQTGADDLRGTNDNLDLVIGFRDGRRAAVAEPEQQRGHGRAR